MKNKEQSCAIKTSIGGQALMEGIMMRGPKRTAMAVRNPQGEIVIEESRSSRRRKDAQRLLKKRRRRQRELKSAENPCRR